MKTALLAVASLALALLLAEGVVRLLPARMLGFEYQDGVFSRPREYAISAQEVKRRQRRQRAMPGPGAAGETRVLLLGDSFVEALTMPDADTVGARLEHHLEARGGRFDVVARGHAGWARRRSWTGCARTGRRSRRIWCSRCSSR